MNKIYMVKWAIKKYFNKDINYINVIVQGEKLTKTKAKIKAKERVENDFGKSVFKRNNLKFFDIVDITDREILTVEV